MRSYRRSHGFSTPLAHTQLAVSITELVAEYTIQQHFENTGKRPVELVYSIPVPLDAAFLGMRAALAGEAVESVIQAATRAEQTYNAALARGQTAAVLSTPQAGVLLVSSGNLLLGKSGSLELRFACSLGVAGLLASTAASSNFHGLGFQTGGDPIELEISSVMLDQDLALEFHLTAALPPTCRVITTSDANLALATFALPSANSPSQAMDLFLLLSCRVARAAATPNRTLHRDSQGAPKPSGLFHGPFLMSR